MSMNILLGMGLAALAAAQAPATAKQSPEQLAAAAATRKKSAQLNADFQNYIMIICGGLAAFFIIYRVTIEALKHIRKLTALGNETQKYFAIPSLSWANFKKHLLYAPIWGKRHNKEFKLSEAVNMGTLPTRFQFLFLWAYLGTNVAFCVLSIPWNGTLATAASALRNRTGTLSVVNMVCISHGSNKQVLILADPSLHYGFSQQPFHQLAQHVF